MGQDAQPPPIRSGVAPLALEHLRGDVFLSAYRGVPVPGGRRSSARTVQDFEIQPSGASLGFEPQHKVRALFAVDPLGRTEVG